MSATSSLQSHAGQQHLSVSPPLKTTMDQSVDPLSPPPGLPGASEHAFLLDSVTTTSECDFLRARRGSAPALQYRGHPTSSTPSTPTPSMAQLAFGELVSPTKLGSVDSVANQPSSPHAKTQAPPTPARRRVSLCFWPHSFVDQVWAADDECTASTTPFTSSTSLHETPRSTSSPALPPVSVTKETPPAPYSPICSPLKPAVSSPASSLSTGPRSDLTSTFVFIVRRALTTKFGEDITGMEAVRCAEQQQERTIINYVATTVLAEEFRRFSATNKLPTAQEVRARLAMFNLVQEKPKASVDSIVAVRRPTVATLDELDATNGKTESGYATSATSSSSNGSSPIVERRRASVNTTTPMPHNHHQYFQQQQQQQQQQQHHHHHPFHYIPQHQQQQARAYFR